MLRNFYKTYGIKPILKSMLKIDDWKALNPVDILFVVHDVHRTYRYKDKAYSPLIDSLQETYLKNGYSCLTIAPPFSQLTKNHAFGEVVDFNGSFFRAAIRRILRNVLSKEELFGTRYIKDVWRKILSATSPRHVISIFPSVALCSACRAQGIEVSDLQHGVINDGHPAYGEAYRKNCEIEGQPTSFMCWDSTAVASLEKWTKQKGIRVDFIRNPWRQRFLDNDPSDELVSNARGSHSWLLRLPKRKRILITLGWGYDGITDEALSKEFNMVVTMPQFLSFPTPIVDVIRETHETIIWFIRPHPAQLKGIERKPLENFLSKHFDDLSNVFWKEVSSTPLTILLESTDLHITMGSTITSEAAMFEIKTGLIAPVPRPVAYLHSYFELERQNGMAEFVPNTAEGFRQFIKR